MSAPTRPGPQFAELVRRLWAWNVSSWRHGDRAELTKVALRRLALLASAHDGRIRPAVPDVGAHALLAQLIVLVDDAWDAGVADAEIEALMGQLAVDLKLS